MEEFAAGDINSVDYWNKRFFDDWIAKGGRRQTAFFAELCCRELPRWFVEAVNRRKFSVFDYGCALGDALPVLQRAFPESSVGGGDVAQVGLGLARALHPQFAFRDLNALGEADKVADVLYCSNTLEHFDDWQAVLHGLARHAREYLVVVVPFEEDERIDEHVFTFEFDSLPARLEAGMRLLHLGVVDAGREPETQWNGLQLIAIYGAKQSGEKRSKTKAAPAQTRPGNSLGFDFREIRARAIPGLLTGIAAISQAKRQAWRETRELRRSLFETETQRNEAEARWRAAEADRDAHAAAERDLIAAAAQRAGLERHIAALEADLKTSLDRFESYAAEQRAGWAAAETGFAERTAELERIYAARIADLEGQLAALQGALETGEREYADLARGSEAAQRWLLEVLTGIDPELLDARDISPVPQDWPGESGDRAAQHGLIVQRLIDAIERANRLGMAFCDQASGWQSQREAFRQSIEELERRIEQGRLQSREVRRRFEIAIGERDHARSRAAPVAAVERAGIAPEAPLVSIILPVYNQAYLVDEAVAGILAQSYRNWELIVLDDGSKDDLEARIRRYVEDRRVVFLRQPNQKLPAALNHAFDYARGELLTWTSADNIMLPTQLERLVEELAANPNAGLVYSDYWAIDDSGEPLDDPRWRAHNRDPQTPDLIRLPDTVTIENFHRSGDNFIGASFMYRRSVAQIVGRYADDTFGGEDYDFWLRMHLATEFRHVAEPLYKYRVHADTLTSRAAELGLFANIRELLEADRWRIDTLLTDEELRSGSDLLRPVEQFHGAILKRCRPVAYTILAEEDARVERERPLAVDLDVPYRMVDATILRNADLLLCRNEFSAALLRQEPWARGKRVLLWHGDITAAIQHAFIQAFADQVTAPVTPTRGRVAAQIDDSFRPSRILLLVERWSSGGLENVVIDLAKSLRATGRTVFVASADGMPPPARAFAETGVRTFAFQRDESAFGAFLRREAIETINYHHSSFAAVQAKELGIATVYTMHNSYLWMDEEARRQVALGLGAMDRVVAVSRQVAQFAVTQFRCPPERIIVVPNGIDGELIAPAARPTLAGGAPFVVAMVASFTRLKLHHVAVAAFAEAAQSRPEMRLRLIGAPLDPAYVEELHAQIAASPCPDRIELIPGLSRDETLAALSAAHVFLLPSTLEGCSLALLEAAAAGCVCIASDVGSARDLAVPGGSVLLVPSPLGELDEITQEQFFAAATVDLPEHRAQVAEALRRARRDYDALAAGVPETQARLRELSDMQQMAEAYLEAYALAARGGGEPRPVAEQPEATAELLAPA